MGNSLTSLAIAVPAQTQPLRRAEGNAVLPTTATNGEEYQQRPEQQAVGLVNNNGAVANPPQPSSTFLFPAMLDPQDYDHLKEGLWRLAAHVLVVMGGGAGNVEGDDGEEEEEEGGPESMASTTTMAYRSASSAVVGATATLPSASPSTTQPPPPTATQPQPVPPRNPSFPKAAASPSPLLLRGGGSSTGKPSPDLYVDGRHASLPPSLRLLPQNAAAATTFASSLPNSLASSFALTRTPSARSVSSRSSAVSPSASAAATHGTAATLNGRSYSFRQLSRTSSSSSAVSSASLSAIHNNTNSSSAATQPISSTAMIRYWGKKMLSIGNGGDDDDEDEDEDDDDDIDDEGTVDSAVEANAYRSTRRHRVVALTELPFGNNHYADDVDDDESGEDDCINSVSSGSDAMLIVGEVWCYSVASALYFAVQQRDIDRVEEGLAEVDEVHNRFVVSTPTQNSNGCGVSDLDSSVGASVGDDDNTHHNLMTAPKSQQHLPPPPPPTIDAPFGRGEYTALHEVAENGEGALGLTTTTTTTAAINTTNNMNTTANGGGTGRGRGATAAADSATPTPAAVLGQQRPAGHNDDDDDDDGAAAEENNNRYNAEEEPTSAQIARRLLAHGANVGTLTADGDTALHLCWRYDAAAVAQALLDNGADADALNAKGHTAAAIAAGAGGRPAVSMVLARGM